MSSYIKYDMNKYTIHISFITLYLVILIDTLMSYVILLYSKQGKFYKVISQSIFEKTPSSIKWKEYHQYIHKYDWLFEMWNILREVLIPYISFLPRYWNTFLPLWLIACNIAALTNMIFEICSCRILDINNNKILRISSYFHQHAYQILH